MRFAFLLALPAFAQMGSPGGGETLAIALHPTDPNILFVGAAKGFCKTTKGGKDNWPTVGMDSLGPRAIALDPANPDVIYIGTYEVGVYKNTDGARSRRFQPASNGITDPHIRALASTTGAVYAGTDGGGVFKTTDGAASWNEMNRGLIDKVIRSLVIDPVNPSTIYAGTWHGVYKSTDGGEHWAANPAGLYDVDVVALALDPTNPKILYAATNPRGVFRSTDGGWTWATSENVLAERLQCIAVDPVNPAHIYVGTRAGIFRSTNSARSFERAGLAWSNAAWALVFDKRKTPPTLYYGGEGGVLKTTNGGKWWDVTGPIRP